MILYVTRDIALNLRSHVSLLMLIFFKNYPKRILKLNNVNDKSFRVIVYVERWTNYEVQQLSDSSEQFGFNR